MPEAQQDPLQIKASPTKEFFIYMLVRDVPLHRAIIDLVDNSIDGARRVRPNGSFDGLWVRLEVSRSHFRIADNCGGIPVENARNYAFRFGRPKQATSIVGSIGQFGVGMKRTFFKLGRQFRVISATSISRFSVEINLDEWIARYNPEGEEDWHFQFKTLEESVEVPEDEQGTTIEIDSLHETVEESFAQDEFITRLSQDIAVAHEMSLDKGLAITLNTVPLRHNPLLLLNTELIQPAHIDLEYTSLGPKPVKVKLYAGLSDRSKEEGGWYVFCNGRMVLRADQSNLTVWDEGDRVPKYHPNFARFRGLAYFDSDDASLLPWTTTKTGVDSDSTVYRAVRQQMIEITRPVLEFLRKVEDERRKHEDGDIRDKPLADAIAAAEASPAAVSVLPARPVFVAPQPPPPPRGPRMQRIQYFKPADEVERAKVLLGVTSFKEVGERTFEYYMTYEGGSDA